MTKVEAYKDSITISNKLQRLFWNTCRLFLFRFFPTPLFSKWRALVLRCFGAKVGSGCQISNTAFISEPWNITIGDRVCIGPKTIISSGDKLTIGDKVTISQYSYICCESHEIDTLNKPYFTKPITIESFAWICADSFVGLGVTIGEGAVVGARSSVFKDVEPWTVVGGNPAKFIKKRVIKD